MLEGTWCCGLFQTLRESLSLIPDSISGRKAENGWAGPVLCHFSLRSKLALKAGLCYASGSIQSGSASREVKEPGNLSRRRQGACASWHDARPERAERRSPCPARGPSFSPSVAPGASPPERNEHHEPNSKQTSRPPRQQDTGLPSQSPPHQQQWNVVVPDHHSPGSVLEASPLLPRNGGTGAGPRPPGPGLCKSHFRGPGGLMNHVPLPRTGN